MFFRDLVQGLETSDSHGGGAITRGHPADMARCGGMATTRIDRPGGGTGEREGEAVPGAAIGAQRPSVLGRELVRWAPLRITPAIATNRPYPTTRSKRPSAD